VVNASAVKALPAELAISVLPVSLAFPTLVAKCATVTDEEQLTRANSANSSPVSVSAWKALADDSAIAACLDSTTSRIVRSASATGTQTNATLLAASVLAVRMIPLVPTASAVRTDITAILPL